VPELEKKIVDAAVGATLLKHPNQNPPKKVKKSKKKQNSMIIDEKLVLVCCRGSVPDL